MNRLHKFIAVAVVLLMTIAIACPDSYALWGRKKYQFTIVDQNGDVLTDVTARAHVNDTNIYVDANIWETETSASPASQAGLTVNSTTGLIEFWGTSDSYNIRITRGIRWDIVKNVGTTKHSLLYLDRYLMPQGLIDASPESAPGMFMLDTNNRIYIGLGSFGNAAWYRLSPATTAN